MTEVYDTTSTVVYVTQFFDDVWNLFSSTSKKVITKIRKLSEQIDPFTLIQLIT